MDPVTLGAVVLAVATGVSEALGGQLWGGLVSLVCRPFRGKEKAAGELPAVSGEAELAALQFAPTDQARAFALAQVLLTRASADQEFGRALGQWWDQAALVREKIGNVTNTVSGGSFSGPVLQGRDFTGLIFGAAPASPAARQGDPDTRG